VGPIGSLGLIVAGAVSLLLFPLLGLVLLLGGIAARLRRAESSETLEVHGGGETASGSPLSPGP